ncbi:MAG TPA: SIMPL domain-containing protein [Anaerolineales bacterium]|nr:SIMPL domain-containing protein [Anaerolineales bacterium]
MKPISNAINLILAALLLVLLLATGLPGSKAGAAAPTQTGTAEPTEESQLACDINRSVQVSGTAVVNVQPDRALLQLGIQSNGKTPKEVQARNAAAIRDVIESLERLGIEARDISTDHYVIEPLYEDYDSLHIKGYRIFNVVAITLRDVDQTSAALAAAFEAGANQVVNVEFYTSELRKHRDQAREMAMKAASEKAGALAIAAGTETGCVLNISENSSSYFNGWNWWYAGGNQNLWTQNAVQNVAPTGGAAPSADDSPVSTGQISVRAEVNVTFALE